MDWPTWIYIVLGILTLGWNIAMPIYYTDRHNHPPKSLGDFTLGQFVMIIPSLPTILVYLMCTWKPFERKVR